MLYRPTRRYENALRKKGYIRVCGIDEAGRGAWAGPIVAACVILPVNARLHGVRDSKLLTARKREQLYAEITRQAIAWGAGVISHEVIDRVGILRANRRAMEQALTKMKSSADYALIDGVPFWKPSLAHEFITGADRSITAVAAASIIAKVTRDELLRGYHKEYPEYGFDEHKGYGTKEHKKNLDAIGPSPIHRRSFRPMMNRSAGAVE